jgi:tetratricopeptide (TPR) repeat protein
MSRDTARRGVGRQSSGIVGLLLIVCAIIVVLPARAAPPGTNELPPPPLDNDGVRGDEDTDGASEEERLLARQQQFEEHLLAGELARSRERHDEAVREFSAALRIQPGDPDALLGRAYANYGKTNDGKCPHRALTDLVQLAKYDPRGRWIEQRRVAVDWMAPCGASHHAQRLELVKELVAEPRGAPGRPDDIRILLAELRYEVATSEKATSADAAELRAEALGHLESYREECKAANAMPLPRALRLQADIYRESEKLEAALASYVELLERYPKSAEARDVGKLIEDLGFELELDKLDQTQGWKPTEEAEAAYQRGMAALRAGNLVVADGELSFAIDNSPWFPRAYHLRGVTRARTGRFLNAVEDLQRAVRMDRSDYRAHMTLGLLYKKEFAGAEDEEAIKHLAIALRLRPDLHRLHLLLGELYARTNREKAREHYQRYLQVASIDDPDARRARSALEELERESRQLEPPPIPPPTEESQRFLPQDLQRMINEAYLRGTEHQDWEMAEKILLEARDRFPREPFVLNQLARVVYAQDRLGDARQYWEQSLAMKEEQLEVHERLGLLLRDDLPKAAVPHLQRAAELGSVTARFVLAELLWEQHRWLDASDQLDDYLAEAGDYDLHWDRALALRVEIDQRFLQVYLAAGFIMFVLVAVPTWRIWRHYRGASLRQLLERDPKSFPEVARILSLIRHEILKHNTAFLVDVGRALELDAPDAEHRAEVLSRRLFGDHEAADGRGGRDRSGGPAGIHGRFLGYLEELDNVARAHRVTLNLHRKDPIFRPMIQAFEELAAWAPRLRHSHGLRPGKKLELARVLNRTGQTLGRQAFERLSGLIRELCVTNVDGELLATVYEQLVGEEQFQGELVAPLSVTGSGAAVRIFRTDLEDILANVLRNSLRSSLLYAPSPAQLGVDLAAEVDEITGLGSLAIRIKDHSPEQLSNEMLRGRYVERGMGITVDLLSRYDGSIGVEPEPGWSKAVVLRFFTLEDDTITFGAEAAA